MKAKKKRAYRKRSTYWGAPVKKVFTREKEVAEIVPKVEATENKVELVCKHCGAPHFVNVGKAS